MYTAEAPVLAAIQPTAVESLYEALLHGTAPLILDVRNEADFGRWHVEGRAGFQLLNIPYYEFLEDEEGSVARVPAGAEVLVVCAKEGSSQYVAEVLQQHGIRASYLQGGIASWGDYYDVREVVNAPFGRIIQVARPARGDVSFVVISAGQAAIIDPLRHIEHYQRVISEAGATLTAIFDTHAHADHISGGRALAAATGAAYYLHPYDAIHPMDMLPATFAFTPLQDGQTLTVGHFEVLVGWFPGHTLGQVNYRFTGPQGRRYLFTGDGLFLRSFGRPDLGGQGERWTPILYQSLTERLPQLADDQTLILPSHFSTLDEADERGRFVALLGQVRRENDALVARDKEEFTRYVLSHLPTFPPQYIEIKRVNLGLVDPSEAQANELELGKNICALS
jgi:glyoxylase-like metal-dependent hydrolase (beta-lactamase superfamily II)/rhodanese-related sulfurtransferase